MLAGSGLGSRGDCTQEAHHLLSVTSEPSPEAAAGEEMVRAARIRGQRQPTGVLKA